MISETSEKDEQWRKVCDYDEAADILGKLPDYIAKDSQVRVVKLLEEDKGCPCGGTHVHHVKDLGTVQITKIQKKKKNTRISYVLVN